MRRLARAGQAAWLDWPPVADDAFATLCKNLSQSCLSPRPRYRPAMQDAEEAIKLWPMRLGAPEAEDEAAWRQLRQWSHIPQEPLHQGSDLQPTVFGRQLAAVPEEEAADEPPAEASSSSERLEFPTPDHVVQFLLADLVLKISPGRRLARCPFPLSPADGAG